MSNNQTRRHIWQKNLLWDANAPQPKFRNRLKKPLNLKPLQKKRSTP